jgi:hypothetical protein
MLFNYKSFICLPLSFEFNTQTKNLYLYLYYYITIGFELVATRHTSFEFRKYPCLTTHITEFIITAS